MPNLTIVRKKERGTKQPLWVAAFNASDGKEELASTSLRQLSKMLREKGVMK